MEQRKGKNEFEEIVSKRIIRYAHTCPRSAGEFGHRVAQSLHRASRSLYFGKLRAYFVGL